MISTDDNAVLYDAIDNYSLLTNSQKQVLKVMIQIAINDEVAATIKDLQEISKVTRSSISAAVSRFDEQGIIKLYEIRGGKFTGCMLQRNKLQEIIAHYKNKQKFLRK